MAILSDDIKIARIKVLCRAAVPIYETNTRKYLNYIVHEKFFHIFGPVNFILSDTVNYQNVLALGQVFFVVKFLSK